MTVNTIYIKEVDSTNRWLRDYQPATDEELTVVWTDYQSAGRGCGSNTWESEAGKNLTFSVLIRPQGVPAKEQFILSMANALALKETLDNYVEGITIKWPNDIYWHDCKICGTLIETSLRGSEIHDCIIGTGLNVNQQQFMSDAPNPVSLWQIHGYETNRSKLLNDILEHVREFMKKEIRPQYLSMLYRRKGFHPYVDKGGVFMAELADVEDDGHLVLCDDNGHLRRYAFKEVQFVL